MDEPAQFITLPEFVMAERWEWISTLAISLRRPGEDTVSALSDMLGRVLPMEPNTCHGEAPRAICTAPNEWLVVGTDASPTEVERQAGEATALAVQVGHGRYWVDLRGAKARAVMAQGCSLDFHLRHFKLNQAACTIFAQLPCIIDHAEKDLFRLCFDRSYRRYVRNWFQSASLSFEAG